MAEKNINTVMPIEIRFDEDKLYDLINSVMATDIKYAIREENRRDRGVINQFIKEILYSKKDEIIEMVVERASREMVKKGLPKLLDKMNSGD